MSSNAGGQTVDNHDLLEFDKLKDEQIGRLAYRDNLFYLTMLIIGGIGATYFAHKDAGFVLLALPWAMWIIGVAHLVCERRIQDIGMYIRERIAPNLAEQTGRPVERIFAWEAYYRDTHWHPVRKWLQRLTTLFLYVGTGVAAVLYYWSLKNWAYFSLGLAEQVFIPLGLGLMGWMAWLIHVFSASSSSPRGKRRTRPLIGLVIVALTSIAAGLAIALSAPLLPIVSFVQSWFPVLGLSPPSTTAIALTAVVIVWSGGLLIAKR